MEIEIATVITAGVISCGTVLTAAILKLAPKIRNGSKPAADPVTVCTAHSGLVESIDGLRDDIQKVQEKQDDVFKTTTEIKAILDARSDSRGGG